MNPTDQDRFTQGIALKDAMRSEAGQLYHKHVVALLNEAIDRLLAMGVGCTDSEIAAVVHQIQGMYRCLEAEGDTIRKGLQLGNRLADKALSRH